MNKFYIEKHSEGGGGRWYSYRCINAEHFYGRCTYHFQWVLGIEIPWWWAGFSRKKQTLNLKLTYSIFRTLIFGNFGCLSGRGNGPIQNTIFSSKHPLWLRCLTSKHVQRFEDEKVTKYLTWSLQAENSTNLAFCGLPFITPQQKSIQPKKRANFGSVYPSRPTQKTPSPQSN